jgi:hypothetical protein
LPIGKSFCVRTAPSHVRPHLHTPVPAPQCKHCNHSILLGRYHQFLCQLAKAFAFALHLHLCAHTYTHLYPHLSASIVIIASCLGGTINSFANSFANFKYPSVPHEAQGCGWGGAVQVELGRWMCECHSVCVDRHGTSTHTHPTHNAKTIVLYWQAWYI